MTQSVDMLIHASSIAINNQAVLLTGSSGSGKSDLALRLIDEGAVLIADDQTIITRDKNQLIASAPDTIRHLIEVRQVGLLRMPQITTAPVALYIVLTSLDERQERLPEADTVMFEDVAIRRLHLPAFALSTPAKIRAVLTSKFVNDGDVNLSP